MKPLIPFPGLLATRLINQLAPTTCLLCGAGLRDELICSACELALPHLAAEEALCQQCALPLQGRTDYCGHCLHKPPTFSRTIAPFSYRNPVDFLIHNFKYRRQLGVGKALGQLLANCIHHTYDEHGWLLPELIIPVPLHWTRRWVRGFNQTDILGLQLSKQFEVPLNSHICRRVRRTPTQKGLNRAARQNNLHHAFQLSADGRQAIEGRRVALLDDVITTTATTRELSRLLVQQGANDVHIWALARTPE